MAKKTKDSNLSIEERLEQALIPNWDEPYNLPKNWCWINLKSVLRHQSGNSKLIKGRLASEKKDGLYDAYSASGQDVYTESYEHEGDAIIVSAVGARCGKAFLASGKWSAIANTHIVYSNDRLLDIRYLHYVLNDESWWVKSGSAQPFVVVNESLLKPFALPPLLEQKRIVEYIETAFAKLDEAKEKAQEVVDGFETRKAAILHKAFSGELTAKWREENDVALTSWLPCAYSELGTSKLGKMLDKSKNSGRQVPYLRNVNVRWFGFDLSDVSQMLASEEEIKLLSVKRGDVFICEGGEPGRCAIWRDSDSNMIFQKALHRFRPNDKIIGDFLCYYLYFLSVNGTLEKYFTGSTIKHLTGQSLAKIIISVPTINEQKEIVDILDRMLSKEQQAKETAEAVIEQIDTMKKAILARAFRGELGTNDPSEKSAVELLKKIL